MVSEPVENHGLIVVGFKRHVASHRCKDEGVSDIRSSIRSRLIMIDWEMPEKFPSLALSSWRNFPLARDTLLREVEICIEDFPSPCRNPISLEKFAAELEETWAFRRRDRMNKSKLFVPGGGGNAISHCQRIKEALVIHANKMNHYFVEPWPCATTRINNVQATRCK